jgi:hypothetical protein
MIGRYLIALSHLRKASHVIYLGDRVVGKSAEGVKPDDTTRRPHLMETQGNRQQRPSAINPELDDITRDGTLGASQEVKEQTEWSGSAKVVDPQHIELPVKLGVQVHRS